MTTPRWRTVLGRTVLAGVTALVGSLALAGPVRAGHTVAVALISPGADQVVGTSELNISARVQASAGGVTRVTLKVDQLGTSRAPITAETAGNGQARHDVSFPVNLRYNGRYKATVTGTAHDAGPLGLSPHDAAGSDSREFAVLAPPAPPAEVASTIDPGTRVVTVTWKKNAEPDLQGYIVKRAKGDGAFAEVALTKETTFVDQSTAEAGGEYRYQVFAVRAGIEENKGIASDPSLTVANVPDPPGPPTAAGPGTTVVANTTSPTSGAPAGSPGALTTSGTVDLSGFRALQTQARRSAPAPRSSEPPDTGFQGTLPFAPRAQGEDAETEEGGELGETAADTPEVGELGAAQENEERTRSIAFLAAGLLATVLLMHVLWVKSEVKRVPLEAVAPEDPASRGRPRPA